MKLAITGSRSNSSFDFTDLFTRQIRQFNTFLGRRRISAIITGGAKGIDRQAEACANKLNIPCKIIRPDYARYQKGAPLKRNLQIIKECDALLVIWNGNFHSHGTIHTAINALKSGKTVFLISATGKNIDCLTGPIRDETVFSGN